MTATRLEVIGVFDASAIVDPLAISRGLNSGQLFNEGFGGMLKF
jgi:hypothetical protein